MDLNASGNNPGTTYTPTMLPNTYYHEDREVNTGSGATAVSQMFRMYNAAYVALSNTWQIQNSAFEAVGNVQNPDGSIHYYRVDATTGMLVGTGNNAVYNAVDFGLSAANTDNGPALQLALDTVIHSGGGTLFIPAGAYTVKTGIIHDALAADDVGVIIEGVAGGAELDFANVDGGALFSFSNFSKTGKGIRLRNLFLQYVPPEDSTPTATAVTLSECQNITCEEVFFKNWATAFNTDAQSGQCGLLDCTIEYDLGPADMTMVSLAGSEDFVRGCVIRESTATGAPSNCVGIELASSNGFFIADVHISDFDYGLRVFDMARDSLIGNTYIEANICAVLVEPSDALANINNICFSNCVFAQTKGGGSGAAGNSGVVVTNPGSDINVAGILFNNCIAYGWGCAGIEIDQGQNIVITGGQFASNGQTSTNANVAAGIAVSGGTQITISGADCSGVNEYWQEKIVGAVTQPTGIAISNNNGPVSDVTVSGCNLLGNKTSAVLIAQSVKSLDTVLISSCNVSGYASPSDVIKATGSPTQVQMIDCTGYNDQGTILQNTTPPPTNPLSNRSSWTNVTEGWFGPVTFYVVNTSGNFISIGNATTKSSTGLIAGTFKLAPGEEANIANRTDATSFLAMGE